MKGVPTRRGPRPGSVRAHSDFYPDLAGRQFLLLLLKVDCKGNHALEGHMSEPGGRMWAVIPGRPFRPTLGLHCTCTHPAHINQRAPGRENVGEGKIMTEGWGWRGVGSGREKRKDNTNNRVLVGPELMSLSRLQSGSARGRSTSKYFTCCSEQQPPSL